MIDDELHLLQGEDVIHVFERGEALSRAAYKHMCGWIINNFKTKFKGNPEELWEEAEKAWDALTPEQQAYLWSITNQESQNAQDVSEGLLACLSEYQCLNSVRISFIQAIKQVREKFQ
jgi:hypothetical protein